LCQGSPFGDGTVRGRGGRDHRRGLRGLPGRHARLVAPTGPGDDGQPLPAQGQEGAWARREERLRTVLYLPAYSPDLNPIEQVFSKLEALLRGVGARNFGALVEAMGRALDAITARDTSGFFRHCGYRASAQLLCGRLFNRCLPAVRSSSSQETPQRRQASRGPRRGATSPRSKRMRFRSRCSTCVRSPRRRAPGRRHARPRGPAWAGPPGGSTHQAAPSRRT
jgi:hypothetical protein